MAEELRFRGGAQIGWLRTSWPFVTLTVRKDRLVLKAPLEGPDCTLDVL